MINVSKRNKEECALSALNILVDNLVKEHGHNATFWLSLIYSTDFFKDLKNIETGYWGEGVAYHKGKLLKELNKKGIPY